MGNFCSTEYQLTNKQENSIEDGVAERNYKTAHENTKRCQEAVYIRRNPSTCAALVNSLASEHKSTKHDANSEYEEADWWHKFFCDTGSADYAIALFTLGLLISTYFLWKSTDKLWSAGEKQIGVAQDGAAAALLSANAAMTTERAYIWPQTPDIGDILPPKEELMYMDSIPPKALPAITCSFGNFGKTPAIIQKIKGELIFTDVLPAAPVYSKTARAYISDQIIRPEKETDSLKFLLDRPLSASEIKDFKDIKKSFYFFGYVRYLDVFEDVNIVGFCFQIEKSKINAGRTFVGLLGGKAYNYRKIQKSSAEDGNKDEV